MIDREEVYLSILRNLIVEKKKPINLATHLLALDITNKVEGMIKKKLTAQEGGADRGGEHDRRP